MASIFVKVASSKVTNPFWKEIFGLIYSHLHNVLIESFNDAEMVLSLPTVYRTRA